MMLSRGKTHVSSKCQKGNVVFERVHIIFYDNSKYIYEYAESVSLRMVMTPLISLLFKKCTHFCI